MSIGRSLETGRAALIVVVLVSAGAVLGTVASRQSHGARAEASSLAADEAAMVARGDYLVKIGGCNDCHTPWVMGPDGPHPDMTRMLSGHPADVSVPPPPKTDGLWVWGGAATNTAFYGPWGVSYAFNLTPEPISGLGGVWTEEMFIRAIRTGKHFGESRPIMPPMPWHAYAHMTDYDLKSIWAYLQTIPPIRNEVPASVPAPAPRPQT